VLTDPLRHGTAKNNAFRLKTDAPVAAYSMYPYGGGVDVLVPTATLLLPVSSWEKAYFAVSPPQFSTFTYKRTLQVVANEDDTEVQIRPTAEIPGGADVPAATTGVPQTYRLMRGQVLQVAQVHELTGSPIITNKPVGVFGGAVCSRLPTLYCDILQQQIPPINQWGTEYAAVPYKPRIDSFSPDVREKVPYSIVAAVDGTVLTYDPARPRGAPETLNAGESLSFYTDEIFTVRSQDSKHPFYAAVYMTSSLYGNGSGRETLGDPDFVNIPATDQFLDRYVFFTDFTYPETTLTVVRKRTAKGFAPVELECAGELTDWKPVGKDGKYEFTWVQLTNGFIPQKFPKGECGYGRQEAHSDGPFAITVWGTAVRASYGYVGGTGLRPINDVKPPVVQ
jgi:IgGFc binding protein